ncbi:MAG: ElyC/SanA/YdcF family protein [Planctomycetota bacterium]
MRRRVKRVLLTCIAAAAACGLCALAVGLCANLAIKRSAEAAISRKPEDVPEKPVAIIFGAKVGSQGPSHILSDRLDAGLRLYKLGKVKKLLLSGDHGRKGYDEVNAMRAYALERGVPPEDIFLDHAGFRTYATLYRARDVFGVTSAVLVTNEFHLPRAIYTGKQFGLDVVGLTSDARTYRTWFFNDCREFLARTLAWMQINITQPRPKYLGPRIDITGDGRVTHDKP